MRKKLLNSRNAILAAAVLALAPMAMLTGCGSSDDPVPTATVTVTGHVEDGSADTTTYLTTTIEARNPADDTVLATATSDGANSGKFSIQVPKGVDFYLHANGGDIGGTTYVADNLQIQNETGASAVKFYLMDSNNANTVASLLGFNMATAAVFDGDVEDSSSTGIAGVMVTPSPTVTELRYQQTDGSFKPTGPTTTYNGPSFIGWVNGLSGSATYTFSLDPNKATAGYTIPTTFKLRLHPGEISDVSAVSYP